MAQDAKVIARPWLPVELSLLLMTKGTELNATEPAGELSEERLKAMRAATGPIRLDWTFREPGEDYTVLELADYPKYNKKYTRTRAYVEAQIKHFKGTHNGADAFNCPVGQGGRRPHPDIGDYYKAVFGLENDSLLPWKALADGGKKLVCTVTHDNLGDKEDWVYQEQIGRTGVYLRPSIIAGDGYQFRAQVSFEDLPSGSSHPNWKVLKKRYPKLPQAHTCRMRNWRKTSLRGYLGWAALGKRHWGNYESTVPDFYRPAFLHWEHEGGSRSNYPLTSFFDPDADADVQAYKRLISDNVGVDYNDEDKISLSEDYIWPWTDQTQLGVVKVPPPGVNFANYKSKFLNADFWNKTWRKFRGPLMNELLKKIAEKFGKLRGHLIVEFDSPAYWLQQYRCSACGKMQVRMERTAGGDGGLTAGETYRIGGCAGALEVVYKQTFVCDTCSGEQSATGRATFLDGDVGTCDEPCTGHLTYVGRVTPSLWHPLTKKSKYRCPTCGNEPLFTESAPYGGRAGTACGRPCPGHLSPKAPSDRAKRIQEGGDDLGLSGAGLAFGGAYLYASALAQSWAHECGHHRFVAHAATAPGAASKRAQHDSQANPKYDTVDAPKYLNQAYDGWDLICIMGYVKDSAEKTDERFFCGKCILKTRGWKVESGLQLTAEVDP